MRIVILSVIAVFALMGCASAQSVPDFSKDGWQSSEVRLVTIGARLNAPNGVVTVTVNATANEYANSSKDVHASVLSFKGQEVSMFWGFSNGNYKYALKINGKWYVSKDNAELKGFVVLRGDATSGIKMVLDTLDGVKEVFLSLN